MNRLRCPPSAQIHLVPAFTLRTFDWGMGTKKIAGRTVGYIGGTGTKGKTGYINEVLANEILSTPGPTGIRHTRPSRSAHWAYSLNELTPTVL